MKHSIIKLIIVIAVLTLTLTACQATLVPVEEDLTAKQLVQKGQDAYEMANYPQALRYYNAVLERFAEDDLALYVEANYEIGHIYMRQKKYDFAKNVFDKILDLYSKTTPGEIPAAYQKLALIELEKIPQ